MSQDETPPASGNREPPAATPRIVTIPAVAIEAREVLFSVHDWIERADLKASILMATVAGALIAVGSALSAAMAWVDRNPSPRLWVEALFLASVVALLVAGFMAGASLYPSLRPETRPGTDSASPGDLVYFGGLRAMTPEDIASGLRSAVASESIADHFAYEISVDAKIAWQKHRWLQRAIAALAVAATFALAGFLVWVIMRHVGGPALTPPVIGHLGR